MLFLNKAIEGRRSDPLVHGAIAEMRCKVTAIWQILQWLKITISNDSQPFGEAKGFRRIRNLQLLEDILAVSIYGMRTNEEPFGNHFAG